MFSFTRPREAILDYTSWILTGGERQLRYELLSFRLHGKAIVVQLDGAADRRQAMALCGLNICVERSELPPPAQGQYYWHDLIGADVVTSTGQVLGELVEMKETGANDVLVVVGATRVLIPFVRGRVVQSVDLEEKRIIVDWDPEFI